MLRLIIETKSMLMQIKMSIDISKCLSYHDYMKWKLLVLLFLFPLFSQTVYAAKPIPPAPVPNSVCIDAGHGGTDIGTINNDLSEKDVNLDVAKLLEAKLLLTGYTAFMTRRGDETLSNAGRYNYCNNQRAAILI